MRLMKIMGLWLFLSLGSAAALADCPALDSDALQTFSKEQLIPLWCNYKEESSKAMFLRMSTQREGRIGETPRITPQEQALLDQQRACDKGADQITKAFRQVTQSRGWPNCMEDRQYAEKFNRGVLEKKLSTLALAPPERATNYLRIVADSNSTVLVRAVDHSAGKDEPNKWAPTGVNTDKILRVVCTNKVAQEIFQLGVSFVFTFISEGGASIGTIPVKGKDCE